MSSTSRYHSFIDAGIPQEQANTTTADTGDSIQVGDLGRIHSPSDGAHPDAEEEIMEDCSSIDENYDVHSITSSIEDQLT